VFDIIPPKDISSSFLKDGDSVDQDAIINHQAHKFNVFFCQLWKYIFKTFPSCHQYANFIKHVNVDISKPIAIQTSMVEAFLNMLYIMKAGLIVKINLIEFGTFSNDCIKQLNDTKYIKNFLIEKMEYRYKKPLENKDNLLFSFFKLVSQDRSIITYSDIPDVYTNPFTGFIIEPKKTAHQSNTIQNISYIISEDVYFLIKLLNSPVIINDTLDRHDDTIKYISKAMGKKCMVLSHHYYPDTYSYQLPEEYIYLLPRISPWCLIICDEWKPVYTYNGLAIQEENNVVMCPKLLKTPPGMNRVISNNMGGYKPQNTLTFWKAHTKLSHNPKSAVNNYLLFVDFIYKYIEKHELRLMDKPPIIKTDKLILLVDNRENDMSVMSCKCALINTDDWACRVITSKAAKGYYERFLPGSTQVRTHPLLELQFDIDIYNDILEDVEMWRGLKQEGYNHVVVIQDDGFMIRKGIDKYLQYDYVGAPWADMADNVYIKEKLTPNMVGNGGFSLRNVDAMIRICEEFEDKKLQTFYHNVNRAPEDIFFVKYLTQTGGKFPSKEEASYFSMEQIINPQCIGFHKFWNYHPYSEVKQLFDFFLH
jgi:hypothetical protein